VCADTGRALHYAGSALWRVVPGEALYGGALAGGPEPDDSDASAAAPPDGRDSAYGAFFEPDADSLPHDRAGAAAAGPDARRSGALTPRPFARPPGLLSAQPLVAGLACAASQARARARQRCSSTC
jgi:hypothetical protein